MAKKKKTQEERITMTIRFKHREERDRFHKAADREGFTTMSSWLMYHMRNQAKETLGEEDD